jgi:hypothetical protein
MDIHKGIESCSSSGLTQGLGHAFPVLTWTLRPLAELIV